MSTIFSVFGMTVLLTACASFTAFVSLVGSAWRTTERHFSLTFLCAWSGLVNLYALRWPWGRYEAAICAWTTGLLVVGIAVEAAWRAFGSGRTFKQIAERAFYATVITAGIGALSLVFSDANPWKYRLRVPLHAVEIGALAAVLHATYAFGARENRIDRAALRGCLAVAPCMFGQLVLWEANCTVARFFGNLGAILYVGVALWIARTATHERAAP